MSLISLAKLLICNFFLNTTPTVSVAEKLRGGGGLGGERKTHSDPLDREAKPAGSRGEELSHLASALLAAANYTRAVAPAGAPSNPLITRHDLICVGRQLGLRSFVDAGAARLIAAPRG